MSTLGGVRGGNREESPYSILVQCPAGELAARAVTRLQPGNRGDVHRVALGDSSKRLAIGATPDSLLALERRELRLAAELRAVALWVRSVRMLLYLATTALLFANHC